MESCANENFLCVQLPPKQHPPACTMLTTMKRGSRSSCGNDLSSTSCSSSSTAGSTSTTVTTGSSTSQGNGGRRSTTPSSSNRTPPTVRRTYARSSKPRTRRISGHTGKIWNGMIDLQTKELRTKSIGALATLLHRQHEVYMLLLSSHWCDTKNVVLLCFFW